MSGILPDHEVQAKAVADNLVIATDPAVRSMCVTWWEQSRPWATTVLRMVQGSADHQIRSAGKRLLENTDDQQLHAELVSALLKHDTGTPPTAAIFEAAWQAECNSRLGYHLGPRYTTTVPVIDADSIRAMPAGLSTGIRDGAEILIVVPFRDQGDERGRLRNLLACLLALRDQSYPRSGYRITVVESDETPRWREIIAPYADHYLFAEDPGPFNKSWAVNVGAMHSPGRPEVLCILDADVLADRNFIARNAARFQNPGTGGHLPYRDMLCLDPAASSFAISERLSRNVSEIHPGHLRGFLLRRPPGCCIWVRMATFQRIGGMDERYQGWGGEDYDFAHRLDFEAPLDTYDDWLLHMYHRPAPMPGPYEQSANARIPSLSWRPTEPIGRLDRFASSH